MLILGKSDADVAWVEEDHIPREVLFEYEKNSSVSTHLQERCISGQTTVTALSVEQPDHASPPAKKPKNSRWTLSDKTE